MKRLHTIILGPALLLSSIHLKAVPILADPTTETDGIYDGASWDLGYTSYMGDIFFASIAEMNPGLTNSIYSLSRSGSGWIGDFQSQWEKWGLPIFNSFPVPGYAFIVAGDNEGLTSNQVYAAGLNLGGAPPLFYNGTAITNEGIATAGITMVPLGAPPHHSLDGLGVNKNGDDASTNLQSFFGTPVFSLWNSVWTNGVQADTAANAYTWFPDETASGGPDSTHFSAGGGLIVASHQLIGLGMPTNVSSLTIDWFGARAFTNHCCAVNITVSGNTLTLTVKWDRGAPPFDANGGNLIGALTNDARYGFLVDTNLGMAFREMLQITNMPSGIVAVYLDSGSGPQFCDVATSAQWNQGRNWFSNTVPTNPRWIHRSNTLAQVRWKKGINPDTLYASSLGSGHTSHIPNGVDYTIYTSHAGAYDSVPFGKPRGMYYLTNNWGGYTMTNDVSQYHQYDLAINAAAQQPTFTLTAVLQHTLSTPNASMGTVHWGTP